ncbi:hypothetical protein B566_EDAN002660, partial [Ephemera danica]
MKYMRVVLICTLLFTAASTFDLRHARHVFEAKSGGGGGG